MGRDRKHKERLTSVIQAYAEVYFKNGHDGA